MKENILTQLTRTLISFAFTQESSSNVRILCRRSTRNRTQNYKCNLICTSLIQYHSRINFKNFITKVLMFYIEF